MDLEKLKIPDEARAGRGASIWWMLAGGAVAFIVGLFVGHYVDFPWEKRSFQVQTMVVRQATAGRQASFTAGGWVEVASPKYPVLISAQVSELLERVHVKEGDVVKPGQLIAELYDKNLKATLARLEAEEAELAIVIKKMKVGFRKEDIAVAEAVVAEMTENLRIAQVRYDRTKSLGKELATQAKLDEDQSRVRTCQARLDQASTKLRKMKAGYREEDVEEAEAKLRSAKKQREQYALQLKYCKISLPDRYPELKVLEVLQQEGEIVTTEKGKAALVSLYDPKEIQVRIDVRQKNIKEISIGDPLEVVTDADRSRKYSGKVVRIDPKAQLAKNTITVRGRIDSPDDLLFPEMVAQITFLTNESEDSKKEDAPNTFLVPETALMMDGSQAYVLLNKSGTVVRRDVAIKQRLSGKVEIASGLEGGEKVILTELEKIRPGDEVED